MQPSDQQPGQVPGQEATPGTLNEVAAAPAATLAGGDIVQPESDKEAYLSGVSGLKLFWRKAMILAHGGRGPKVRPDGITWPK